MAQKEPCCEAATWIRVPVVRGGAVREVLSASLRTQARDQLLDRLPRGWYGAVLVISRDERNEPRDRLRHPFFGL